MILNIGLNPLKWGKVDLPPKPEHEVRPETRAALTDALTLLGTSPLPTTHQENIMADTAAPAKHNAFVGFLISVGHLFTKGLGYAVQYAPSAGTLVSILFPGLAPGVKTAETALDLIQKAVISVEQKYAAAGIQNGTGAQKSAEVLTLTTDAVTELLTQAGVKDVTTERLQSIVSAVVAILNAHGAVTA